jgi:beta-xylosidase
MSYHPYTQLPEGNTPSNLDFVEKTSALNQKLRAAGVNTLWSTEWGWSTYKGPKEVQDFITTQGQADYIVRRVALMSALDFDKIFLFTLSDLDQRASVRDQSYGLLDIDANPKPSYTALQNFLQVSGPKLTPGDPPTADQLPDGLFSIGWSRADGRKVWFFWSARGGSAHLPGMTTATLYDPLRGTETPLSGTNGLDVPVKPNLQILLWD